MNNTIQAGYGMKPCGGYAKAGAAKQAAGFPRMAAQSPAQGTGRMDSLQQEPALSEAEEMQLFKEEFYAELEQAASHPSLNSVSVKISDEAFRAMKNDPEYRSQVLSLLRRDMGSSVAPRSCSLLITVGATLDQYRGDSWPAGNDSEYRLRSQGSFYQRASGNREKQKALLEEYQERKAQAKQRQQQLLDEAARERSRMAQIGIRGTSFPSISELMKAKAVPGPYNGKE